MSKKLLFTIFLLTPAIIIAAPPTSKYLPGETTDPNCSPGDTNCDIEFIQGDATDDAFINNTTDGRVELGTKSDGLPRALGEEVIISDIGNIGLGVTPATNRRIDILSQEERAVIHAETLDTTNSTQGYAAHESKTPASTTWVASHGEHRTLSRWGLPTLAGWSELHSNGEVGIHQGLVMGTKTATPVLFGADNLERMRVESDGRVGVGATSPNINALFHVEKNVPDGDQSKIGGNFNIISETMADVTSYERAARGHVVDCAIPSGVTDSGYKIGGEFSVYANKEEFEGMMSRAI